MPTAQRDQYQALRAGVAGSLPAPAEASPIPSTRLSAAGVDPLVTTAQLGPPPAPRFPHEEEGSRPAAPTGACGSLPSAGGDATDHGRFF
jgi:hypothetical protein